MVSAAVALAFAAAVLAQVLLAAWLARIYATIPAKIPYGTAGNRYFWYGPRAVVWLAPGAWLAILVWCGVAIAGAPAPVRMQPWLALPFAFMALVTPLIALAIRDKIEAARRHESG